MLKRALKLSSAVTLATTLLLSVFAAAEQGPTANLDVQTVVERMTAAQIENHERARAYKVVREYNLTSEKKEAGDRVVAEVSFVPPGTKEYAIRNAEGGRGEKVVRRVLEHEAALAGTWEQTALTDANYSFDLEGTEIVDGYQCYVLGLAPKRDSKDLIRGRAYIDASTYKVRRIEGEPAKSPSWWVKKVAVTLYFQDVRGSWMQTGTRADAEVRLFGRHTLESRDIDYRVSDVVAEKLSTPSPGRTVNAQTGVHTGSRSGSRRTSMSILGTGVVLGPH